MKVFLDTNILLDNFDSTRPSAAASRRVVRFCEQDENQGVILVLSVANILYILRRMVRVCEAKTLIVQTLCGAYDVASLERGDLLFAAGGEFDDYEDGLQILAAEKTGADCIVTSDKRGFSVSKIKVMTPQEFVEIYESVNST